MQEYVSGDYTPNAFRVSGAESGVLWRNFDTKAPGLFVLAEELEDEALRGWIYEHRELLDFEILALSRRDIEICEKAYSQGGTNLRGLLNKKYIERKKREFKLFLEERFSFVEDLSERQTLIEKCFDEKIDQYIREAEKKIVLYVRLLYIVPSAVLEEGVLFISPYADRPGYKEQFQEAPCLIAVSRNGCTLGKPEDFYFLSVCKEDFIYPFIRLEELLYEVVPGELPKPKEYFALQKQDDLKEVKKFLERALEEVFSEEAFEIFRGALFSTDIRDELLSKHLGTIARMYFKDYLTMLSSDQASQVFELLEPLLERVSGAYKEVYDFLETKVKGLKRSTEAELSRLIIEANSNLIKLSFQQRDFESCLSYIQSNMQFIHYLGKEKTVNLFPNPIDQEIYNTFESPKEESTSQLILNYIFLACCKEEHGLSEQSFLIFSKIFDLNEPISDLLASQNLHIPFFGSLIRVAECLLQTRDFDSTQLITFLLRAKESIPNNAKILEKRSVRMVFARRGFILLRQQLSSILKDLLLESCHSFNQYSGVDVILNVQEGEKLEHPFTMSLKISSESLLDHLLSTLVGYEFQKIGIEDELFFEIPANFNWHDFKNFLKARVRFDKKCRLEESERLSRREQNNRLSISVYNALTPVNPSAAVQEMNSSRGAFFSGETPNSNNEDRPLKRKNLPLEEESFEEKTDSIEETVVSWPEWGLNEYSEDVYAFKYDVFTGGDVFFGYLHLAVKDYLENSCEDGGAVYKAVKKRLSEGRMAYDKIRRLPAYEEPGYCMKLILKGKAGDYRVYGREVSSRAGGGEKLILFDLVKTHTKVLFIGEELNFDDNAIPMANSI